MTLKIDLVNSTEKIIQIAKETISIEQKAIANLENLVDNEFAEAVNHIYNSNGRVIVSGIGKSANIATKIVATMNSTGTPAIFMHAADAIHGDLGTVQKNDTVICISKSGNTPEIKVLVPLIKKGGNKLSGGDAFIIVFFVIGFVYFVGGMALNYHRTGIYIYIYIRKVD